VSLVSEPASILLTWIINLIKWHAGHNKYKFDESGGQKIMNNARNLIILTLIVQPMFDNTEPEDNR